MMDFAFTGGRRVCSPEVMIEAIRTMENTDIDTDALALWSVIRVRWPEWADYLHSNNPPRYPA
jgi:hypothetical protein